MTTKPNPQAVIRAHMESHMRLALADAYSAQEYPKLRDTLAAVAELVEVAKDAEQRLQIHLKHSEDLVVHMRIVKALAAFEVTP